MIELARTLSSKYTRSKVRKAMPEDYAYILDELLHAQKDEDDNQVHYHKVILDTVIEISGLFDLARGAAQTPCGRQAAHRRRYLRPR